MDSQLEKRPGQCHGRSPEEVYEKSAALKGFKREILRKTKGCVLMEHPAWLPGWASRYGARNTSNRRSYPEDLRRAAVVPSHGSCPVIPEKSFLYRLAKKAAFLGMGAYG